MGLQPIESTFCVVLHFGWSGTYICEIEKINLRLHKRATNLSDYIWSYKRGRNINVFMLEVTLFSLTTFLPHLGDVISKETLRLITEC